jgi:hypothetical protein
VDTDILSQNEMVTLTSGEAAAAASGDATLVGAAESAVDNTLDGEYVWVIADPYAVYAVTDANARAAGDTLDIASGGMGVTTSGDADLTVVTASTASEKTHVMITHGERYLRP